MEEKIQNIIECDHCGLFVDISQKKEDIILKCPRCNSKLPLTSNYSFDSLYYCISAFFIFILLNIYPLVSISIVGKELKTTLIDTVLVLYDEGFFFVSFIIFFTIILSPICSMLIIIYSFIHNHTKFRFFPNYYIYNLFHFFKKWSFIDVFIVSIIVTYIKLIGMVSTTQFDIGFYLILFYLLLFFMANRKFSIKKIFEDR